MKTIRLTRFMLAIGLAISANISFAATEKSVAAHYATIAHAVFDDALSRQHYLAVLALCEC